MGVYPVHPFELPAQLRVTSLLPSNLDVNAVNPELTRNVDYLRNWATELSHLAVDNSHLMEDSGAVNLRICVRLPVVFLSSFGPATIPAP